MHSSTILTNNNRIESADALRGFAVMGITCSEGGFFPRNVQNGNMDGQYCEFGRNMKLTYSEKNMRFWTKALIVSIIAFFPIYGLIAILPDFIAGRHYLFLPPLYLNQFQMLHLQEYCLPE